ncbi:MAG: class II glutamine amidotransferase [Haemophilus parainfluenzae]|jgi:glutamine amidotransferase, class-II|nr:MAG: class II glutamine amidotransferase [Haemophilus parainfluenzae]
MCQLLGMNCNTPTDMVFSFQGFSLRGGLTAQHADGFGIAFFDGKGVRCFRDPNACYDSSLAQFLRTYPIRTLNAIAHVRKASQGEKLTVNTHPFIRELWGQYWVFAHNGQLDNFSFSKGEYYHSVGDSDSEQIFCYILEGLRTRFGRHEPNESALFNALADIICGLKGKGLLNFLLSNGKWMIAHCSHLLFYTLRHSPFGEAELVDEDFKIDFSKVTTLQDKVAVIATLPLTRNETWEQLAKDELIVFKNGAITYRKKPENSYYYSIEEGQKIAQAYAVG